MMVAQTERRNTKITATTSAMVSARVNCTSSTEARMVWVRSLSVWTFTPAGREAVMRGSSALIRSTVSMTLAPGCLKMTRNTPRWPLAQAACLASSGPATAWPMSRTRSGAPLR